jgi:hypothetical protein
MNTIFEGNCVVEFQGEYPLLYMGTKLVYYGLPEEFIINEFNSTSIIVHDYRPDTHKSLRDAERTDDYTDVINTINKDAWVVITRKNGDIHVNLMPPHKEGIYHTLWCAVGMTDFYPALDYIIDLVSWMDKEKSIYALFTVYKNK